MRNLIIKFPITVHGVVTKENFFNRAIFLSWREKIVPKAKIQSPLGQPQQKLARNTNKLSNNARQSKNFQVCTYTYKVSCRFIEKLRRKTLVCAINRREKTRKTNTRLIKRARLPKFYEWKRRKRHSCSLRKTNIIQSRIHTRTKEWIFFLITHACLHTKGIIFARFIGSIFGDKKSAMIINEWIYILGLPSEWNFYQWKVLRKKVTGYHRRRSSL